MAKFRFSCLVWQKNQLHFIQKTKFKQPLNNYILTFCLFITTFSSTLNAQVFWSEDFSGGGIPAGWTNEDLTSAVGEEVIFLHATDPAAVNVASGGWPGYGEFLGSAAANGYLWANSLRNLTSSPVANHTTQLTTTAINCSTQSTVYVGFEGMIGVFDLAANTNALLRVSNDGIAWTSFEIFPGITTTVRWADNPHAFSVDISSIAAEQSTVYLQFEWIGGWEYYMALDEIVLSTEDPKPPNSMRVNDWHARAPNALTPASQVEPIAFMADIENVGGNEQTNVVLSMTITDPSGTVVFENQTEYGTIASDSLVENVFFTEEFTPPSDVFGIYNGTYELTYDNIDTEATPDDNIREFSFGITENSFAKSTDFNVAFIGQEDSYTYGCVYHINNSGDFASSLSFAVNNANTLAGDVVSILLFEWEGDTDLDGNANEEEYTIVGLNSYEFDGTEANDFINVQFNEGEPVALEEDNYYIVTIQYASNAAGETIAFLADDTYNYQAVEFVTDSLERPRYTYVIDNGNEGILNLGATIAPMVTLNLGLIKNSSEVQLLPRAVSVYPNPVSKIAKLDFNLENITDVKTTILNMKGQVVKTEIWTGVSTGIKEIPVQDLPNGTYLVRVDTELGVRTLKLIVQH